MINMFTPLHNYRNHNSLISNIKIPLDSGDFSIMDRTIVDILNNEMPEYNRFVRGLRAYSGFKQIGIEYDRDPRFAGETKYTYRKLIKLALDGIFDFSTFPKFPQNSRGEPKPYTLCY